MLPRLKDAKTNLPFGKSGSDNLRGWLEAFVIYAGSMMPVGKVILDDSGHFL